MMLVSKGLARERILPHWTCYTKLLTLEAAADKTVHVCLSIEANVFVHSAGATEDTNTSVPRGGGEGGKGGRQDLYIQQEQQTRFKSVATRRAAASDGMAMGKRLYDIASGQCEKEGVGGGCGEVRNIRGGR